MQLPQFALNIIFSDDAHVAPGTSPVPDDDGAGRFQPADGGFAGLFASQDAAPAPGTAALPDVAQGETTTKPRPAGGESTWPSPWRKVAFSWGALAETGAEQTLAAGLAEAPPLQAGAEVATTLAVPVVGDVVTERAAGTDSSHDEPSDPPARATTGASEEAEKPGKVADRTDPGACQKWADSWLDAVLSWSDRVRSEKEQTLAVSDAAEPEPAPAGANAGVAVSVPQPVVVPEITRSDASQDGGERQAAVARAALLSGEAGPQDVVDRQPAANSIVPGERQVWRDSWRPAALSWGEATRAGVETHRTSAEVPQVRAEATVAEKARPAAAPPVAAEITEPVAPAEGVRKVAATPQGTTAASADEPEGPADVATAAKPATVGIDRVWRQARHEITHPRGESDLAATKASLPLRAPPTASERVAGPVSAPSEAATAAAATVAVKGDGAVKAPLWQMAGQSPREATLASGRGAAANHSIVAPVEPEVAQLETGAVTSFAEKPAAPRVQAEPSIPAAPAQAVRMMRQETAGRGEFASVSSIVFEPKSAAAVLPRADATVGSSERSDRPDPVAKSIPVAAPAHGRAGAAPTSGPQAASVDRPVEPALAGYARPQPEVSRPASVEPSATMRADGGAASVVSPTGQTDRAAKMSGAPEPPLARAAESMARNSQNDIAVAGDKAPVRPADHLPGGRPARSARPDRDAPIPSGKPYRATGSEGEASRPDAASRARDDGMQQAQTRVTGTANDWPTIRPQHHVSREIGEGQPTAAPVERQAERPRSVAAPPTVAQTGRPEPAASVLNPVGLELSETDAVSGADSLPAEAGGPRFGTIVSPGGTIQPTAEAARHVAVQIAEVAGQAGSRTLELTLQPEELGTVKLKIQHDNGNVSVALTIDRPETLDLMRRHIDILGAELRRMGYGTVDFSFAGGGQDARGQTTAGQAGYAAQGGRAEPEVARDAGAAGAAPARPNTAREGMDIRI